MKKKNYFHKNISSLYFYTLKGMLGLRWLCMYLWLNLINQKIYIQEKVKIVNIYVQSKWRVDLLWYHRFW